MTTTNVHDLSTIRRRFVRAKAEPSWPDYDPADDDTFFLAIASAEMSAHHHEIDCAACGSPDVTRTPLRAPDTFGALTQEASGRMYGYALCSACCALRSADPDAFAARVDAAFDGAVS